MTKGCFEWSKLGVIFGTSELILIGSVDILRFKEILYVKTIFFAETTELVLNGKIVVLISILTSPRLLADNSRTVNNSDCSKRAWKSELFTVLELSANNLGEVKILI